MQLTSRTSSTLSSIHSLFLISLCLSSSLSIATSNKHSTKSLFDPFFLTVYQISRVIENPSQPLPHRPSLGNPCISACLSSPSSLECAQCCRTVRHEVPWNCPKQGESESMKQQQMKDKEEEAAACCFGNWSAHCWDTPSALNHFHPCVTCCGDCSTVFSGCGHCSSQDTCYCGGCVDENGKECSQKSSACYCPYSSASYTDDFILISVTIFFFAIPIAIVVFLVYASCWICRKCAQVEEPQTTIELNVTEDHGGDTFDKDCVLDYAEMKSKEGFN